MGLGLNVVDLCEMSGCWNIPEKYFTLNEDVENNKLNKASQCDRIAARILSCDRCFEYMPHINDSTIVCLNGLNK